MTLTIDTPALSGSIFLLTTLVLEIGRQEIQFRENTSPDALHDYRVIIRKIRTLLAQLDDVLSEPGLSEFKKGFSAVMEKTSYLRDLEGCCAEITRHKDRLGHNVGSDIDPLLITINKQEKIERRKVLKYLRSDAYSKLKADWSIYLQRSLAELDTDSHTLKRAWLPMQTVANEAVSKSYLKIVSLAAGCNKNMSAAGFHKLRKSYKKLRYLIEIFTEIFPVKSGKNIVQELKTLQGKLGLLQDTEVQLDILKSSVAQIEDRLDKSNKKAIREMIRYIKNKRKKARINAVESINKFTRYSAKKIDLLLC